MNAVGKMLVVLQLCLSLLFVCFAGATYSLQDTWRAKATAAESQVASLQGNLADVQAEKDRLVGEAERQMKAAVEARDNTAVELETAQRTAESANRLLAEVEQARDRTIAENIRAAAEADSRRAESVALRQEIETQRNRLAAQLAAIREKENEVLDQSKLLNNYRQSDERQVAEKIRLTDLLRSKGIDPNERVTDKVPDAVAKVDGRVLARLQSRSRTQEFVRITLGSDDEIEEGMVLPVFRQDKFVCDIRISVVKSDTSVGIVVASSRQSSVQEGDRVTTRL